MNTGLNAGKFCLSGAENGSMTVALNLRQRSHTTVPAFDFKTHRPIRRKPRLPEINVPNHAQSAFQRRAAVTTQLSTTVLCSALRQGRRRHRAHSREKEPGYIHEPTGPAPYLQHPTPKQCLSQHTLSWWHWCSVLPAKSTASKKTAHPSRAALTALHALLAVRGAMTLLPSKTMCKARQTYPLPRSVPHQTSCKPSTTVRPSSTPALK